jgi:hypothetical protein
MVQPLPTGRSDRLDRKSDGDASDQQPDEN